MGNCCSFEQQGENEIIARNDMERPQIITEKASPLDLERQYTRIVRNIGINDPEIRVSLWCE